MIRDRSILDAIPKFHPYSAMLKYTSVAILVCGDLIREKFKGSCVQDCSAAAQNLLLRDVALLSGSFRPASRGSSRA